VQAMTLNSLSKKIEEYVESSLKKEFEKGKTIYTAYGPLTAILEIPYMLEKNSIALIGIRDGLPEIVILKYQGHGEVPGMKISIDLLNIQTKETSLIILPGPLYAFISKIKDMLGNENPLQYHYTINFKEYFIQVIAEVPKIYMEKGKVIQDIQEISQYFTDYRFFIQKMAEFLKNELISGSDETKLNEGV